MKKYVNSKLISFFTIILFFGLLYFFINTFGFLDTKEVQAVTLENVKIQLFENANPINIESVLQNNIKDNITEEMLVEEIDLEYTTKYINNSDLPSGTMHVIQIGIDGKQDVITIKRYNNGELESEKIVAQNIKRASINKIIEIGTGRGINNYELKVDDEVYTTPSSLMVMAGLDKSSEKLITLSKGTKVKVLEIYDNGWSYISSPDRKGYVLSEGLSNINPNKINDIQDNATELSKSELVSMLSFGMDVGKSSQFSLEQFRKVLGNNSSDVNGIFSQNADYFYYAEQEYGINGVFLAAIAIHESGWGTSNIAKNKNNLFGYMAYDNSAYASAKQFENYAEGIDLLARVLIKYYLNPAGTEVYGGNIAEGKYYNGSTIQAVNKNYASDKNWANSVYSTMKKLYENL